MLGMLKRERCVLYGKKYLLGIDIGTYESKVIICGIAGRIYDVQVSPQR